VKQLGGALHRPAVLAMPAPVVRLLIGEMAHLLLTGQRAIPKRTLDSGYPLQVPRTAASARFGTPRTLTCSLIRFEVPQDAP
jgi:NAD dependent epimerase/dehydratase family enzyme